MKFHFIKAKAIENIHAGRANASTDSIDKVVQRDIGGIPCVESTAFKGALKEHFPENIIEFTNAAFGSDDKDGNSLSSGQYGIKQLDLLALPVPIYPVPEIMNSAVLVTSWEILDQLYESISLYSPADKISTSIRDAYLPFRNIYSSSLSPKVFTLQSSLSTIPTLTSLGKSKIRLSVENLAELPEWLDSLIFNKYDQNRALVICNSSNFSTLTSDFELPVKHRNRVDYGESKNLWIEQFLPRGTRFITKVRIPDILYKNDNSEIKNHLSIFQAQIDGTCLQIGANKSVGYGECFFNFL